MSLIFALTLDCYRLNTSVIDFHAFFKKESCISFIAVYYNDINVAYSSFVAVQKLPLASPRGRVRILTGALSGNNGRQLWVCPAGMSFVPDDSAPPAALLTTHYSC